jgi:hypothetical protein
MRVPAAPVLGFSGGGRAAVDGSGRSEYTGVPV